MNHQMPVLGGIAAGIRWVEELVTLTSGPLLTVGLGIALVDLLTGGGLLRGMPELLYAWAVSQAIGIDAQLVAAWDRTRTAIREKRWLAVIGLVILGCALGYVGFLSAEAFSFQQAFGLTEADALQRLGIDGVTWQLQRAVLAVFLVALSGFTRFHAPPKVKKTLEAERAELERELALEPLRVKVRQQQALGIRALAKAATRGEKEEVAVEPEQTVEEMPPEPEQGRVLRLVPDETFEAKARRVLERNPQLTNAELTRLIGCSASTAARLKRKLVG
jgi:hypothetical protein